MAPARRWPVISALGVVQIMTWGSSFYLPSVLAAPMSADTGWPLGRVVGGLSLGLLVAGLASSRVGTDIGEHGGRPILAFAAVALAVGLAILGLAPNLPTYLAALPVVGLALVLYGAGNGIYSIARGTVPLALFGPERDAPLVGRLARPGLVAQALAPSLGGVVLTQAGADATYVLLSGLALANIARAVSLWRVR